MTPQTQITIAGLKMQIAQNNMYADACSKTFDRTGRSSAYNQAQQHLAAAEMKRARIEKLEAAPC
jgi:hypothetical protein